MNDDFSSDPGAENPFQTPPSVQSGPGGGHPMHDGAKYVRQVSIVAILMLIHGVVLAFAGVGATGIGVLFGTNPGLMDGGGFQVEFDDDEDGDGDGEGDPGEAEVDGAGAEDAEEFESAMQTFVTYLYGGVGALLLLIGITQIYAGIRNLGFKSRTTGIVALSLGILAVFTCYCAPTSIGLAIYGLIVYLNPTVAQAFQLRAQGHSKEDILARFPAQ